MAGADEQVAFFGRIAFGEIQQFLIHFTLGIAAGELLHALACPAGGSINRDREGGFGEGESGIACLMGDKAVAVEILKMNNVEGFFAQEVVNLLGADIEPLVKPTDPRVEVRLSLQMHKANSQLIAEPCYPAAFFFYLDFGGEQQGDIAVRLTGQHFQQMPGVGADSGIASRADDFRRNHTNLVTGLWLDFIYFGELADFLADAIAAGGDISVIQSGIT